MRDRDSRTLTLTPLNSRAPHLELAQVGEGGDGGLAGAHAEHGGRVKRLLQLARPVLREKLHDVQGGVG